VAAFQFAVPAAMLGVRWAQEGSRPVSELPASFQMYSAEPPITYLGTDRQGHLRPLDVGPLPPVLRAVDTGRVLPDRFCAWHADLVAVQRIGGTQPGSYPC
jgi:hypothetical protein